MPPPLPPPYVSDAPTTFVTDTAARQVDPFLLEYAIYDVSTEQKRTAPVQVYPSSGRAEAERVGLGYFKAPYTTEASPSYGRRMVRWWATMEEGDTSTRTWTTPWELLTTPKLEQAWPLYALVCDLRDAGFTTQQLSDVRAQELLADASATIHSCTGRIFAAMPRVLTTQGRCRAKLLLTEEIISLESILVERGSGADRSSEAFELDDVFVYARHLTHRQLKPDDRENPCIEVTGAMFPRATLHLTGAFGYTDPDGSPMGRTPRDVAKAAMLLVRRSIVPLGSPTRQDSSLRARVIMEKTRDQEVRFASPDTVASGDLSGDAEVDKLLMPYIRPPGLGAV
jgi:hypothetical protein